MPLLASKAVLDESRLILAIALEEFLNLLVREI